MNKVFWKTRAKYISLLLLVVLTVVFMFPFIWAVAISLLKEARLVFSPQYYFKPPFEFKNWIVIFGEFNLLQYITNTLIITVSCIFATVLSNSFIAYGFARFPSRGMEALFVYLLSTMFMPGVVMSIPQYIIWSKLGGIDTYLPFILPAFFGGAMNVFLLRQSYRGLPNSLPEAAYIDGMNDFRIWLSIYVPLSKPIIAFIIVQEFMTRWNDFMGALIYLSSPSKYTLMLGLRFLSEKYNDQQNIVMAATIVSIIPVLLVYIFAQKQFVAGLTAGAVKS